MRGEGPNTCLQLLYYLGFVPLYFALAFVEGAAGLLLLQSPGAFLLSVGLIGAGLELW